MAVRPSFPTPPLPVDMTDLPVPPPSFADAWSTDRARQNDAYGRIMEETQEPVGWAYVVWGDVVRNLAHPDNHNRAIAAQVLCNLAKSDPEGRLFDDLDALLAVTRDERTVTARHALQSLWKIGEVGPRHRGVLLSTFTHRFERAMEEDRHGTLVRSDIAQGLRNLYDATGDEAVEREALRLIETVEDPTYRKKYASLWRGGVSRRTGGTAGRHETFDRRASS